MAKLFKIDDQGGFVCGDPDTRITAYAYPSSEHAVQAARSTVHAAKVASAMLLQETAWRNSALLQSLPTDIAAQDARNWAKLQPEVAEMVKVTLTREQNDEVEAILRRVQREARSDDAVLRLGVLLDQFQQAETQ